MAAKALPKALRNETSAVVLQNAATPSPPRDAMVEMGESGGKDAMARLNEAMKELKALAIAPLLKKAIDALNRENFVQGGKWALKALDHDDRNGVAWYLLAIARERAGDFPNSVRAYEAALQLLPEHADVANDLGRLAYRMGMFEQAEKLFVHYVNHAPHEPQGYNNLASAVKDQGRADEAIDILKAAIAQHPGSSMLWNTIGTAMIERGDLDLAATFIGEAVRLDPKFHKGRYNLSQIKLHLGFVEEALTDCNAAIGKTATADDREMMRLARASYQLALGRLAEGWEDYEARLSPQFADVTHFAIDRPRWKPGQDISGKRFLVVAEQGLGDEILFGNVLPDIVEALGPDGKLHLAVERRLVTLFQRRYPDAEVSAHVTNIWATRPLRRVPGVDLEQIDLWAPMASLMRQYRRSLEAFPTDPRGYMIADPQRVAHWRKLLEAAPAGPKVGLLWKSAVTSNHRHRYFSPFERWAPVLATPGVTFVNLQYGDCSAEIEQAERDFGVKIWSPPDIDLKQDLDDVTALTCAMDLVIGFSNATFNLGAAAGAPSWLISAPGAWPRLGLTDRYAWYPQTRVFVPEAYQDWDPVFDRIAKDLAAFVAQA
ncbi:tetratricopeptide repeat protein [Phenylobacterium sp.]|uniref:tetratricopeptide repeat-containing glycosyltransferase family protein n=1 Tax=Phenylobacterium sp. TaxID=1871053 RepID=UPI002ED8CCEE